MKLLRPEGEIDFVASPNLTAQPYDEWTLLGRKVKVETAAEIVAKKLWHRGGRATARDLFDLSLVIEREPEALATAALYLVRHRDAFLTQIQQRRAVLGVQFEVIDALAYRPTYDERSTSPSEGEAAHACAGSRRTGERVILRRKGQSTTAARTECRRCPRPSPCQGSSAETAWPRCRTHLRAVLAAVALKSWGCSLMRLWGAKGIASTRSV
ncbi:nucleotidyl transferase AbiEii/AbiGii toxin family protein [Hydrogenophaga pseudoflava]|uniref:nucleotidyl transferase AbiEii/AbiGii toxin family protein n=1 Tax=Hydrogenophaga pseudoflava TaxID=47421 RepID=UPI00403FDE5C